MFRLKKLWPLLVLAIAGCVFKIPAQPPSALEITAPSNGDAAYVGQHVSIAVHLHEHSPTGAGRVEISGPEHTVLSLTFSQQVTGLHVAEVVWVPNAAGEYELRAYAPVAGGKEEESSPVKVQVVAAEALQRAPLLAGEIGAAPLPQPTPVPTTPSPQVTTQAPPSPTPSDTPTPSVTPLPCLRAKFVADVTVPDGTLFEPGQSFTKTWRLQNVGSCPWSADFAVVFDSGDRMNAPDAVNIGTYVAPGQMVDVSVPLTAPTDGGTYRANFKLRSPDGRVFGLGDGQAPFYVEIRVARLLADLHIQGIAFVPATPVEGQGFTVYVTVVNQGEVSSGPFGVTWQTDPNSSVAYCSWNVNNLAPDETQTLQCPAGTQQQGFLPAGNYTTVAIADAYNQVQESDENNNRTSAALQILSGDTSGPVLKPSTDSSKIYWPPQYCTPYEVTIRTYARDESGIAWVRLTYRVIDDQGNTGQWVTRDMTLSGTDTYLYTLTAADLEASLNPPVHSNQGRVEFYISAADTVGNITRQDMRPLELLYCLY